MEILSDYKTLHLISVVRCSEILQRICYVIVVMHCLEYEARKKIIHLDQFVQFWTFIDKAHIASWLYFSYELVFGLA